MKKLIALVLAIAAMSPLASIPAAAASNAPVPQSVPYDPGICGDGSC